LINVANLSELSSFLFQTMLNRFVLGQMLFCGVATNVFCDAHRAKVRAAHGAEVRGLSSFLWQRLVVEFARSFGIECEIELIFPAKFEARLTNSIVAVLRAGMAAPIALVM